MQAWQQDLRYDIRGLAALVAAAFLAGYLPARRAARLDPATALRAE